MYHRIVRSRVRQAYRNISAGQYREVVRTFAPDVVFSFHGEHAMGGELHGVEAVSSWFERVYRLFPGLQLEPLAIVVDGPPWNTVVATRFTVRAELPDGVPYRNEGMQYLRLRFGKAVEDHLYEDTAALDRALAHLARHGREEALSPSLAAAPTPASEPDPSQLVHR
jgi:ketosteroid isomerase-like protein